MRSHLFLATALLVGAACTPVSAEYVRFVYTPGVVKRESADPSQPHAPGQAAPVLPGHGRTFVPGETSPDTPGAGDQDLDRTAVLTHIIVEVKTIRRVPTLTGAPTHHMEHHHMGAHHMGPQHMGPHHMGPPPQADGATGVAGQSPGQPRSLFLLEHKWGKTLIMETPEITFFRVEDQNAGVPTVRERYESRRKELGKNPTPEKLLALAEFCLTHGLTDRFHKVMNELVVAQPGSPQAALYQRYTGEFKRVPPKESSAPFWKDRLGQFKTLQTAHYDLLSDAPITARAEIDARLRQLEENFEAFFYWFALQGRYLPLPDHRLTVVVPNSSEDFTQLHGAFDHPALAADGFLARRENLIVLSPTPLAAPFDMLSRATNDLWVHKGWNRQALLKGLGKANESAESIAYAQQAALLLQVMQERAELASVSHLGGRQLAGATGLLPASVSTPRWAQFGVGSFFETPPSAYWPGTGAPHWTYLLKFKIWDERKLLDRPEDALYQVVTDSYFRRADGPPRDEDALLTAQTMAWSLTYFLARQPDRLEGLLRYSQELARLPRDMEFDGAVYLDCFLRAFDLADPSSPDGIDARRFQKLAREWYQFMRDTNLEVQETWTLGQQEEDHRTKGLALPRAKPGETPARVPPPPAPGHPHHH